MILLAGQLDRPGSRCNLTGIGGRSTGWGDSQLEWPRGQAGPVEECAHRTVRPAVTHAGRREPLGEREHHARVLDPRGDETAAAGRIRTELEADRSVVTV